MYADKNYISLSYRAQDEDTRDTDLCVDINFENANDAKLCQTLNRWLKSIDADLVVQETRNK